jgi:hypothetical protein
VTTKLESSQFVATKKKVAAAPGRFVFGFSLSKRLSSSLFQNKKQKNQEKPKKKKNKNKTWVEQ